MNLEAIAMRRAEEQTHDAHRPDPDEDGGLTTCSVPGCVNDRAMGHLRCHWCIARDLTSVPCKGCGGLTTRADARLTAKHRRGYCAMCRASMAWNENPGRWPKGVSGNPAGKNRTAVNWARIA